jgi:hypothetical protein
MTTLFVLYDRTIYKIFLLVPSDILTDILTDILNEYRILVFVSRQYKKRNIKIREN